MVSARLNVTATTTTTTIMTTTVFESSHVNLTPLMILAAVVIIIVVCSSCLIAYNSVLKHKQLEEKNARHMSYGYITEEFLHNTILVRLCGFRRCMQAQDEEQPKQVIIETKLEKLPNGTNGEQQPLLANGNAAPDYAAVFEVGSPEDNGDAGLQMRNGSRTLAPDEIVVYDASNK